MVTPSERGRLSASKWGLKSQDRPVERNIIPNRPFSLNTIFQHKCYLHRVARAVNKPGEHWKHTVQVPWNNATGQSLGLKRELWREPEGSVSTLIGARVVLRPASHSSQPGVEATVHKADSPPEQGWSESSLHKDISSPRNYIHQAAVVN